jgi:hypothetical protein
MTYFVYFLSSLYVFSPLEQFDFYGIGFFDILFNWILQATGRQCLLFSGLHPFLLSITGRPGGNDDDDEVPKWVRVLISRIPYPIRRAIQAIIIIAGDI